MGKEKKVRVSIVVDQDLRDYLEEEARRKRASIAQVVRELIAREVEARYGSENTDHEEGER